MREPHFILLQIGNIDTCIVLLDFYSCGLSTATIGHSCQSVCVSVCVCVHINSNNYGSVHLKLEHIVVYENSSYEVDIGHCLIKVKVTA